MHLFNDNLFRHDYQIYMKQKEGERVQDSGETEGECVREGAWKREEVVSVVKRAIGET